MSPVWACATTAFNFDLASVTVRIRLGLMATMSLSCRGLSSRCCDDGTRGVEAGEPEGSCTGCRRDPADPAAITREVGGLGGSKHPAGFGLGGGSQGDAEDEVAEQVSRQGVADGG